MSAYIKFDGIEGECNDKQHKGWTNITSATFTATKPGEGLTGQSRRRGDVKLEDISCTKELDWSSLALGKNICIGKVFKKVWIEMTASYNTGDEASGGRQRYLAIELDNVAVSNYSLTGDGEEPPTEEFSLNYEYIKFSYTKYKQDGSKDNEGHWTWDIEKSQP